MGIGSLSSASLQLPQQMETLLAVVAGAQAAALQMATVLAAGGQIGLPSNPGLGQMVDIAA